MSLPTGPEVRTGEGSPAIRRPARSKRTSAGDEHPWRAASASSSSHGSVALDEVAEPVGVARSPRAAAALGVMRRCLRAPWPASSASRRQRAPGCPGARISDVQLSAHGAADGFGAVERRRVKVIRGAAELGPSRREWGSSTPLPLASQVDEIRSQATPPQLTGERDVGTDALSAAVIPACRVTYATAVRHLAEQATVTPSVKSAPRPKRSGPRNGAQGARLQVCDRPRRCQAARSASFAPALD